MAKAEQRGRKPKKRSVGKTILKIILGIILAVIILVLCVFFFGGYFSTIMKLRSDANTEIAKAVANPEEVFTPSQTGVVYDMNEDIISQTVQDKNSEYVKIDNIPKYIQEAFVSIEDKNFYKHHGVDYKAILRAIKSALDNSEVTQGGSTITMQLARNVFLSQERTWQRKVEEIFIARGLERNFSKNQILEYYLNNIYFANGYYGIGAAAKGYFGVFSDNLSELSLAQCAYLAAIPNSPTYYDPEKYPEHTKTRQELILQNMYEDGDITQDQYNKAVAETITLSKPTVSDQNNNYVITYAYHCATEALMANDGFQFQYAFDSDDDRKTYEDKYQDQYDKEQQKIYGGGYKIYTTIDMDKQKQLQDAVDSGLEGFTGTDSDGAYQVQGAAVCIDNDTGQVVAIVGGREQDELGGYTLNRAYQSYRQPGSSIKPLLVYTPAFDTGDYSPTTSVTDRAVTVGNWSVHNDDNTYHGTMALSEAVQRSLNTVAVQVYEDVGYESGLKYLTDMDFHKIVDDDKTLVTAIGGFTDGVLPVEQASGFAALENDGEWRKPTCLTKIEHDGDEIYTYDVDGADGGDDNSKQVYQKNSALMMTSILQGTLDNSWGTGYGLGLYTDSGEKIPAAAKTGTTDNSKDGWLCGYTKHYTTAVWVGSDDSSSIHGLYGSTYPGTIWHNFMQEINKDLDIEEFEEYQQVSTKKADYVEETPTTIQQSTTVQQTTADTSQQTTADTSQQTTQQSTTAVTSQGDNAGNGTSSQDNNSGSNNNGNGSENSGTGTTVNNGGQQQEQQGGDASGGQQEQQGGDASQNGGGDANGGN